MQSAVPSNTGVRMGKAFASTDKQTLSNRLGYCAFRFNTAKNRVTALSASKRNVRSTSFVDTTGPAAKFHGQTVRRSLLSLPL